jgi:uncharacterized protein (DUF305 family)
MHPRAKFLAAVTLASFCLFVGPVIAQDSQGEIKAFTTANQKMMDTMAAMKPSGDADMDFVMMMIPHHQGAIDMAQVELQYGKDPMLRDMAQQIIKAQQDEIAKMKKWQQEHGM